MERIHSQESGQSENVNDTRPIVATMLSHYAIICDAKFIMLFCVCFNKIIIFAL